MLRVAVARRMLRRGFHTRSMRWNVLEPLSQVHKPAVAVAVAVVHVTAVTLVTSAEVTLLRSAAHRASLSGRVGSKSLPHNPRAAGE